MQSLAKLFVPVVVWLAQMIRQFNKVHQERRAFDYEQMKDRSRVGMPMTLTRHDKGLSTIIGRPNRDASGKGLDDSMQSMMQRLRTWDHRIQVSSPTDRNLARAFELLEMLKGKLGLPDNVIEKAAYIYRKVQQLGMVKGRTIAAYFSCVYLRCL